MNSARLMLTSAAVFVASTAWAAVTADPAQVTITSPTQKVSIKLSSDGKPIAATAIKGYTFNVEARTYEYMIALTKLDGGVVISPTKEAQVGTYELTINTSSGAASVKVLMPLNDAPDSLENQAKALGITVDELLERNNVSKPYGREKVTFGVPANYVAGDTFKLDTPCPADRDYEWLVNGKSVKTGHGPEPFAFTFPSAGTYVIEYHDKKEGAAASGEVKIVVGEKTAAK